MRDGVLAIIYNDFTNLKIEGDSKVIINWYNRSSSPSSIILLIEDILRLSQDLNIYNCGHIYRKANRTTDCFAKKCIYNTIPNIWCSNFPKDVIKFGFEDYCGLSFNRIYKFPYSYSLSTKKIKKKIFFARKGEDQRKARRLKAKRTRFTLTTFVSLNPHSFAFEIMLKPLVCMIYCSMLG